MLLDKLDGREIVAVASSLAIAFSEGLSERQLIALASFFSVLGQSLGAIASNAAGADIQTGGRAGGTDTATGGSGSGSATGSTAETTAGFTAITGVRVQRGTDITPTGRNEWYSRADGTGSEAGTQPGPTGTQDSQPDGAGTDTSRPPG